MHYPLTADRALPLAAALLLAAICAAVIVTAGTGPAASALDQPSTRIAAFDGS